MTHNYFIIENCSTEQLETIKNLKILSNWKFHLDGGNVQNHKPCHCSLCLVTNHRWGGTKYDVNL